jgi:hypothetical protein
VWLKIKELLYWFKIRIFRFRYYWRNKMGSAYVLFCSIHGKVIIKVQHSPVVEPNHLLCPFCGRVLLTDMPTVPQQSLVDSLTGKVI